MSYADDESPGAAELDGIAREFLVSQYAGSRFAGWPIERRLEAYLSHCGLADVADDGNRCAALMDRVMANIASALGKGTLTPGIGTPRKSSAKRR